MYDEIYLQTASINSFTGLVANPASGTQHTQAAC